MTRLSGYLPSSASLKLAQRLAFSPDPRQRWRQVSVISTAFFATLLVLFGAAMVQASRASDQRIQVRSPVWAASEADAVVHASLRGLTIEDYQFPVVWLDPVEGHEDDPDAVPPGLSRLPAPGEAVLSPGLAAAGLTAEDLGLRPSTAGSGPDGTIGPAGLSTTSEGWVYARPGPGRTLGQGGALLSLRGYVAGAERASLETIPQLPGTIAASIGVAWLVLGPALMLLWGGARALSSVRTQRAGILLQLGITPGAIRWLLATETALLVLTGLVPALMAWQWWVSSWRSLWLTGTTLNSGALALPWWQITQLILFITFSAALVAVLGPLPDRSRARGLSRVRSWHVVPLVAAVILMIGSRWSSPDSGSGPVMLFSGLLLTFAALPMALPVLVARLGDALGTTRRPWAWLAGRRLSLRSANLSRPAAAVGLLVFLAGGAFALYGRLISTQDVPTSQVPLGRFDVSWRDERAGDLERLSVSIKDLQVLPISGTDSDPRALFETCTEAQRVASALDLRACERVGLDPAFVDVFARVTTFQPALGTPPDDVTIARVLLLGDVSTTSREVMQQTAGALPAVNITQIGPRTVPNPGTGWIVAGWVLATMVLSAALLREVGDRVMASLSDDSHLRRLGLSPREINRTQRWTVLPPVLVAIPLGYVAAVAFAIYGYQLGFTVDSVLRITVVAAAVAGTAGIALAATFAFHRRIVAKEN